MHAINDNNTNSTMIRLLWEMNDFNVAGSEEQQLEAAKTEVEEDASPMEAERTNFVDGLHPNDGEYVLFRNVASAGQASSNSHYDVPIPRFSASLAVICGKDKLTYSHPGNKYYHELIRSYRSLYQSATRRDEKKRLTATIISLIHERGGRFVALEETVGAWRVTTSKEAREKVSHALRTKGNKGKQQHVKRRSCVKPLSHEEQAAYEDMLLRQREFYDQLVEQEERRKASEQRPSDSPIAELAATAAASRGYFSDSSSDDEWDHGAC